MRKTRLYDREERLWHTAIMRPAAASLFGVDVPDGFEHRDDFISDAEETSLVADIGGLEFANFEMRGVIARRRVAFFGASYDQGSAPTASPP